MEQISGPKRFFRFAWRCARHRFYAGLISTKDYELLGSIKTTNGEPEITLLRRCFPEAVKSLEEFAIQGNKIMWSPETVGDYWHQHKGKSPTKTATVCSTGNNKVLVYCDDNKMIGVYNDFNFGLRVGKQVRIHLDGIAEPVDF